MNRIEINGILIFLMLLSDRFLAQTADSPRELNTPGNIKSFADFLYKEGDYLRSAGEYRRYLMREKNDSVQFLLVRSLRKGGDYNGALGELNKLSTGFKSGRGVVSEHAKILFLTGQGDSLRVFYNSLTSGTQKELESFYYLSLLYFNGSRIPEEANLLGAFDPEYHTELRRFLMRRIDPPYKSPVLAGILSAVIPGAGKIYTGYYSDGITAFIATGLSSFLAFDNFKAGHNFRGWLFTAMTAFFYSGNIFGSVISAEMFNSNLILELRSDLREFINIRRYLD